VPVAAGLMAIGASPGAAFAFLMTGPATNAATLATLWKVTGRRTTAIYLGTMLAAALGGGLLLDALVLELDVGVGRGQAWMPPAWVGIGSAVVLLGVLACAVVTSRRAGHDRHEDADAPAAPQQETLTVAGMTCSHCVETVRRALAECPGVQEVRVALDDGRATVRGHNMDPSRLREAIEEVGYSTGQPA
jgi:copper chaperone CopZ